MKLIAASIIILNWNGKEDTKKCLLSLTKLEYKYFEVILVDNGSTDGSVKEIREFINKSKFQFRVVFVENELNLGFSGGNIEGLKRASGEYIVLLNNDTAVDSKWLGFLIETASKNRKIGVVAGKALEWNENNKLFDKSNGYFSYQIIDPWLGFAHTLKNKSEATEVDSISGCAVLIKREVIGKIGFLDPLFFAYYEETDLFARVLRAGYKIFYEPRAIVWHQVAKSSNSFSYFYYFHMARNRAIFAIRNFDEPFYRYFKRDYIEKGIRSVFSYYVNFFRGKDMDTLNELRARKSAFSWILFHWAGLKKQRNKITGNGSYNKKLTLFNEETVSVIIPSYNYSKYISKTIESALKQTVKPLEIIVVDDGSTDNSVEVIKKYPVKLIEQNNQGVVITKNNGFERSAGRFVLFLDADDILESTAIEEYLKAYRKDKSIGFVYSDMEYFDGEKGVYKSKTFNKKALRVGNYIHNSALIKREAFQAVGGYHDRMNKGYEDWDFYISLVEQGYVGKYVPKSLLLYRRHVGALSRNIIEQDEAVNLHFEVYRNHRYLFPLWYKAWKWFYFKTYYGTGTTSNLFKVIYFIFRLFYKFITLIKLIILFRWKEVGRKINGEMHFWKALMQKKKLQ